MKKQTNKERKKEMGKLYKKLEKYAIEGNCPMHMPGHKRNTKLLGNKLPYNIDITEIYGFDNLHSPEGIIKEIEDKARKIFSSKRSFILVNGSTCGILAGIRAAIKPYDKILIAKNCHKSVYNAIELNFLKPVYIEPKTDQFGIDKEISPKQVEKALQENPDIKLIVITSPTYEGIISNIKEISKIAHKHKIPVLVDEAHGAHLNFVENLKKYEAINSDADIVIQSLHKTMPALTQCAIMHIQGDLISENEVERELSIFETSSPSYILMASIDECLSIIEEKGEKLFKEYEKNLEDFYSKAKQLKNLKILENNLEKDQIYDNGKIVVITRNTNINGKQLADILRIQFNIEIEMANVDYIIAMTSICDEKENFEKLIKALLEIDTNIKHKENKEMDIENTQFLVSNNKTQSEFINYKESEGKTSKEYIWIYPPGIPIITPGEKIKKETIRKIENIEKTDIKVKTTFKKFPDIKVL